ncbi:uncharacterized protein SPAPADRAFT_48968 [Spathaspora passalidarum NRRL Y-27907]|uniref:Uncharacterized protein n=1 Tax=Spathaspora passalidarum (strain NRRL Y-27907 / 11-Y1) TaxID=619300 RepID=G3AJG0_SPAPN|nr:uncharacterized protein SPAPADRAFT_48968 [Spathaspora passalidarum NRRL Y-27907]EGW33863.1 hypothetical protein SPAPADRAFT_48968 [Spathaspora passalidarum NRRL Y-27907]
MESDAEFQTCCSKLNDEFGFGTGNIRVQDIGSTQPSQVVSSYPAPVEFTYPAPVEFTYPAISTALPTNIYHPFIAPQVQTPNLPLQELTDLKKLTNSELRAMIRESLQNPYFLDLVTRLDKIIED